MRTESNLKTIQSKLKSWLIYNEFYTLDKYPNCVCKV